MSFRIQPLTAHFTGGEFLTSKMHGDLVAGYEPTIAEACALTRLACALEHVRAAFGPLFVFSGLRPRELNDALRADGDPASLTSQHPYGEAADIAPTHGSLEECFYWALERVPTVFCQVIGYAEERPNITPGLPPVRYIKGLHVSVASLDPARPVKPKILAHWRGEFIAWPGGLHLLPEAP
jgi:hypothetical protein